MSVSDARIGANVTRLRGGMTQSDLASAMRERGWKWSQWTVYAIEKGERSIRLAEAEDLAAVLGAAAGDADLSPLDLLDVGNLAITATLKRIRQDYSNARVALDSFRGTQMLLQALARENEDDLTLEQREQIDTWLREDLAVARGEIASEPGREDDGEHPEAS